ncbi:MAG: putative protein YxeI [Chlamydiales bacterium]|nr:putative protein YxeI [Chlamydiales bacterium]MCH9635204.1 putative protein YxeI [Chlamydiales bacterium]
MEFGVDLHSEIIVRPAGQMVQSRVFDNQDGMKWQVKYAYFGLSALGLDWLVDGQNEAGLSIGGLWFPGADYPKVDQSHLSNVIPLEDLGDYLLATCATTADVKKALDGVQVWAHEIEALGQVPPLHLSVHDRLGKSVAIEFLDGKAEVISNPVGVLTNAPKLTWHLTNLNNYINLSAVQKGSVRFDGMVLTSMGEGFGMLGLPGDWTPPSRFVRIANFKDFAEEAQDAKQNVNLAFHLLNTVDIPYGVIRSKEQEHFDYTQWVVVKDLVNNVLYVRTYDNLNILSYNLKDLLADKKLKLPLVGTQGYVHHGSP